MLRPSTAPLALAALLVSLAATAAQAAPAERSVVLTGTAGEPPVLHLEPGVVTLILLDAAIVRESVEVEGRARFTRVDPGDQSITLALRAPLEPGERLALRFTYREGSPRSAVLLLTMQPGAVDQVVNVSRPQQSGEACRVELAATRERCEAQARELEALKARPPALSPAAVALAGFVSPSGMKGKSLALACNRASGELRSELCWVLGAEAWSVVVVVVRNTGEKPWVPAWAEVTPEGRGTPGRVRSVLSTQAALLPGGTAGVAVEVEMPKRPEENAWLTVPHVLRVCDEAGSRCLSLPGVKL